jgi:hypothetical protein
MGILPGVQRTGYGTGREGGLLGRQRGMGLFDKDKTQAIINAIGEAMPEDGHRQADERFLISTTRQTHAPPPMALHTMALYSVQVDVIYLFPLAPLCSAIW